MEETIDQGEPKLSVKDFAAKVKAKYPVYKDIDDSTLTQKIIDKYPAYKDQVDFSVQKKSPVVSSVSSHISSKPIEPFAGIPDASSLPAQAPDKDLTAPALNNAPDNTTNVSVHNTIAANASIAHIQKIKEATPAAIDNTTAKSLQIKGIKALPGSVQFNLEKAEFQKHIDNGDARVIIKNGVPGLQRTTGFFDNLKSHFQAAKDIGEADDKFVNHSTIDEMVKKVRDEQVETKSPYLKEAQTDAGQAGAFLGDNAIPTVKDVVGGVVGAGAAALGPETGGISVVAGAKLGAWIFTAHDAATQQAAQTIKTFYSIIKKQNPTLTDTEAMQQAVDKGKLLGASAGLITDALLVQGGAEAIGSKSVVANALSVLVKSSVKGAAKIAGVEAAKDLVGNLEGVKQSQEEILKKTVNSFKENVGTLGLLHIATGVAGGLVKLPKILNSAIKYTLAKTDPAIVDAGLKVNVDAGNITPETSQKVKNTIANTKVAISKVAPGLEPDSEASITGLIEKRTAIEAEAKAKDVTAQPLYDEKIDATNKQITKIQETGKPFEHEIDEATGKPYVKPGYSDEVEVKVQDLADRIAKGKPVEEAEDIQLEQHFPDELRRELKVISRQEREDQAGKENAKTDLGDNVRAYLESKVKPDITNTESNTSSGINVGENGKIIPDEVLTEQPKLATSLTPEEHTIVPTVTPIANEATDHEAIEANKHLFEEGGPFTPEDLKLLTDAPIETDKAKMDGTVTDHVINGEGNKIELPTKGYLINDVALKEGQEKGKGSGQELYKKALDEHGVLYSHWPISEDAMRVHDKLVKKGIASVENIELSDGTQVRKITKLNETKSSTTEPTGNEPEGTNLPENQKLGDQSPAPQGTAATPEQPQTGSEINEEVKAAKPQLAGMPGVDAFFEHDVNPLAKRIGLTAKATLKSLVNALSPTTGVSEKAITHMMTALGSRNEAIQEISKAVNTFEKIFDKMKNSERIDFIDRMKTGQKQTTPGMQDIADALALLDKNLYDEITKHKPGLTWKENHFRVLWKVVPGTQAEKVFGTAIRRPFRGSQGFAKKATLADMSEGIAKGGVPQSTNPITMFKLAYADGMKYITAQRMFEALKGDKMIKFVKKFGDVPEGFVPINDNMAKVYFNTGNDQVLKEVIPAIAAQFGNKPLPEGWTRLNGKIYDIVDKKGVLGESGSYFIEEGAGRLLNNHLSKDYLRDKTTGLGKLGSGLLEIKNLYTQVELGLSAFHAMAEGLETTSSTIGTGLRKLINLGTRGDFKSAGEGILDIIKSPFSAKTTFTAGRNAIKLASVKDFETSEFGKGYLKKTPAAQEYIHDFFMGGGIMHQSEDLKSQTFKAFKEQAGNENYIGAALRALPALNETLMSPLFNHVIPAWKVGMFMKEWPLVLKENESRLAKGDITREQLSRKTVAFIDDRLGELNFQGLFWKNTFKTAMQFMFRSVTWKLGNLRAMGGAPIEQAMEFINAAREKRAPMLSPKLAWVFGLATTTVAFSAVIQYMATGKKLSSLKDVIAPQINPDNPDERVMTMTYFKDVAHSLHSPSQYAKSSLSGPVNKIFDIWNNKDFYNYEIYDSHDDALAKVKDAAIYFFPKPFSITSALQMSDKGEPASKIALSFLGLNKAPGYITHSDIQNEIFDLYNVRNTGVQPLSEKEGKDAKKEISDLYKSGDIDAAQDKADEAVKSGVLRPQQIHYLFNHIDKLQDPSILFFNKLPKEDREYLYNKMDDDEKAIYDPRGKMKPKD